MNTRSSSSLATASQPHSWTSPQNNGTWPKSTPSSPPPAERLTITAMTTTHVLETDEADIAYDVHGPLPTADGRRLLVMIGQPMTASGFSTLASHLSDRTVVTYDPRGLGRSTRRD